MPEDVMITTFVQTLGRTGVLSTIVSRQILGIAEVQKAVMDTVADVIFSGVKTIEELKTLPINEKERIARTYRMELPEELKTRFGDSPDELFVHFTEDEKEAKGKPRRIHEIGEDTTIRLDGKKVKK